MDLWIRSQDKEILVKANALWIMDNQIWMEVPFYENHKKVGLSVTGHNHKLASYKTKERALEVLDEIQKLLLPKVKVNTYEIEHSDMNMMYFVEHAISDFSISQSSTYVYEMPEE